MDERENGWESRLAGATRAYVERGELDRPPAAVVADVTARPTPGPRQAFAVIAMALIFAMTGGLAALLAHDAGWSGVAPTPTPTPAQPPQVWPAEALPPPYDWNGVRAALAPRGVVLEVPTVEERRRLTVAIDEALTNALDAFQSTGEHARPVSAHLAAVTHTDERLRRPLVRELMYVVETTGHRTGNCFTLLAATRSEVATIGACFYPNRGSP